MAIITLVFVGVMMAISYTIFTVGSALFQQQLAESTRNNSSALLSQSRHNLIELATSISLASRVSETHFAEDNFTQYVNSNWDLMQFEWGLESLMVIDLKTQEHISWGDTKDIDPISFQNKNQSIDPHTEIICSEQCSIYAELPVYFMNGERKYLVIGKGLTDFIISFAIRNDLKAALLRNDQTEQGINYIPEWQTRIAGMTQREEYLALIQQVASSVPFEQLTSSGETTVTQYNKSYYLHAIKLNTKDQESHNYILLAKDVSNESNRVIETMFSGGVIALLGLISAIVMVYYVLNDSMRRVKQQAKLLPLLVKREFEIFRKEIGSNKSKHFFSNELDILEETTVTISGALESLYKKAEHDKQSVEKALAFKSQFLSTMSHELRTPINGVLGLTELLTDTNLDDKQSHMLDTIQLSTEHLLHIINEILDYSKLEAGKIELEQIIFSPYQVVDECLSMFQVVAQKKGLTLRARIEPSVARYVMGDPARIKQILFNFLNNAFKFTTSGQIEIEVSCETSEPENHPSHLRFSIKDSGIGISKEQHEKLFQDFSQVDASISRKYGGTGLGLAICARLAKLMNGNIGVESVIDVGSKFWFTTPMNVTDACITQEQQRVYPVASKTFGIIAPDECAADLSILLISEKAVPLRLDDPLQISSEKNFDAVIIESNYFFNLIKAEDNFITNSTDSPFPIFITGIREEELSTLAPKNKNLFSLISPVHFDYFHKIMFTAFNIERVSDNSFSEQQHNQFSEYSVLVAEDNEVNRMVIKGLLLKLGIDPVFAFDGALAVEAAKNSKKPFDVIFMDCQMPNLDGYSATQEIRLYEKSLNTPASLIVGLSAHVQTEYRDKAFAAGMNDYLTKPIKLIDLRNFFEDLSK